MKSYMYKISDKIIAFLPLESIEAEALVQIKNTSCVPCLFKHVAVMLDTHYGKGSTVGTVLATKGAIIPAAVGVDIGCGMIAIKTMLKASQIEGKLQEIRAGIERRIPMSAGRFNQKITKTAEKRIAVLEAMAGIETANKLSFNWREQLGTLGGGNHFIEICIDENQSVWLTLHSGSRGVGNKIGNFYIKSAQQICESRFIVLPDRDLSYLVEGKDLEFDDYVRDLRWAQMFAFLNREEMMDRLIAQVAETLFGDHAAIDKIGFEPAINCHHNFTQIERHFGENVWVTRKGAIEASEGKRGMIPGSMGTASYIVSGKGEKMAFNSAPHGAGRRLSRSKARATFTMDDFDKAMVGIEHRRSDVLIDELPMAYKDIHEVIKNADELVKVDAILKQILNVKGD